jgi:hypothetical protein
VYLRFAYLVAVRIIPTLRLSWRGDDHKTIKILLLRHQLARPATPTCCERKTSTT